MKIFHQIKVLISINRSIFMMSNLKTSPKNLSKKKQTNKQTKNGCLQPSMFLKQRTICQREEIWCWFHCHVVLL